MRAFALVVALFWFAVPVFPAERPQQVSLVELIAEPTQFEGQRVVVVGYLKLEFEGNALYLHRDDCEQGIFKNGLWVELTREDAQRYSASSGTYALVEGTFIASDTGHKGLWSGSLRDISKVTTRQKREVVP